jgi:hypothetical protein
LLWLITVRGTYVFGLRPKNIGATHIRHVTQNIAMFKWKQYEDRLMSFFFAVSTLLPALRSDGYRIVCDLLNEQNLGKKALTLAKNILTLRKVRLNIVNVICLIYIFLSLAVLLVVSVSFVFLWLF